MVGLYKSIYGLHREALPQAVGQPAQLHAGLHGDQTASAPRRPGAKGEQAFDPPQEAATRPDVGDDAASGRLDARVADRRRDCLRGRFRLT